MPGEGRNGSRGRKLQVAGMSVKAINEILNDKTALTVETATLIGKALGNELASLSLLDEGPARLVKALRTAGIGFFVLSHLTKSYLDGAALFVKANPFVVWTGRFDRNDNFWFTVAHELAHVVFGHVRKEGDEILDELGDEAESEKEKAADALAGKWLKAQEILDFAEPYKQYLSRERIERCAAELGLHPGIVVGRLQHAGILPYKNLNNYKVAVLDGLGEAVKVG